jgi:hypothetical protein
MSPNRPPTSQALHIFPPQELNFQAPFRSEVKNGIRATILAGNSIIFDKDLQEINSVKYPVKRQLILEANEQRIRKRR